MFAVALFRGREWSRADRAVLETVVRSLRLALERSEAVRALAEEREALGAFAHFTERTAGTRDVARGAVDSRVQRAATGCRRNRRTVRPDSRS